MNKRTLEKIDFAKEYRDLYTASSKVKEVKAEKAAFLSVEGQGEPGGPAFQSAIQQLYSLAYTTKFMLKNAGRLDFAVGKLECLWPRCDYEHTPKSEWSWQILIRIPDSVSEKDLKQAREEILKRHELDTSAVKRWTWTEGRCVQVMHIGPYDEVGKVYSALDDFATANRLVTQAPGHEIYISDPRRVPSAKLKTIVRLQVREAQVGKQ